MKNNNSNQTIFQVNLNEITSMQTNQLPIYYRFFTMFCVSIFLITSQSCSPTLKLNKNSSDIQVNDKIELRAQAKRFKQKDGPVKIKWIVNGEEVASGESFLFSTTEPGIYNIRAEAAQGDKKIESEIKLSAQLYAPSIIDLVNGVEKFPIKPETPLVKTKTERDTLPIEIKKEGEKEVRTVWAEVKETFSASKNPDEFVMFDPNANVLWPGALVQGKSIASGVPAIIPISEEHRLPGNVTLSILSGDGSGVKNKFYKETVLTKSKVTQTMNEILSGYNGTTPAQYSYSKNVAYSSAQIQFDLAMGYAGPSNKVDGKLGLDWSQEKSRMVVKLHQKFFTMTYDDPQGVEGVFKPSITYNDLKPYCGAGNPACYISSVTYGRIYVLLYESEASQLDLEAALNYAYDGVVADGYVEADLKVKLKNNGTTVKSFQIGGDSQKGLEASLDPLNPEKIRKFIVDGANFSSNNPGEIISYTVNYLKDASLVRMNSAMEYTVTQKTPLSSEEFILVPAIVNKNSDEAEATLRSKGFNMKITSTVKDCSKTVGTVTYQNKQPGELLQAGSTVDVIVVADRPDISPPNIEGGGKLHLLLPEGSYSEGAWAGGNTAVSFSLGGDECTTGTVIMKHALISERKYNLKTGDKQEIKEAFGAGAISIKFVSSDPDAKLHLRIW